MFNGLFNGSYAVPESRGDRRRAAPESMIFAIDSQSKPCLTLIGPGKDAEARLAILSTYLGHVNPKATYWYLSAAPELLQLAADRLQRHLGGVS